MALRGKLENMPLLEVLQVIAYTEKSGVLQVDGGDTKGTLVFDLGKVICAHSPESLPLLVKAAKENDPQTNLKLRRIQALVTMTELFHIETGSYELLPANGPVQELEGLDLKAFYAAGGLDTGDLLLVLAKSMDEERPKEEVGFELGPEVQLDDEVEVEMEAQAEAADEDEDRAPENRRQHTRYGPTVIRAELTQHGNTHEGYLTDVSAGGAFFHCEELPYLEGGCDIKFTLPQVIGRCEATARVAWVRTDGNTSKRGAGLSFTRVPPSTEASLKSYLKRFQDLAEDLDF